METSAAVCAWMYKNIETWRERQARDEIIQAQQGTVKKSKYILSLRRSRTGRRDPGSVLRKIMQNVSEGQEGAVGKVTKELLDKH